MRAPDFHPLAADVSRLSAHRVFGSITHLTAGTARINGLGRHARLGDRIRLVRSDGLAIGSEVLVCHGEKLDVLPEAPLEGFMVGDHAEFLGPLKVYPCEQWIGHVLDPDGNPLDGARSSHGQESRALRSPPPPPVARKPLGPRMETGLAVMNTFLPMVQGQRLGLFAGSGVGKSTLLGKLTRSVEADISVIALIGERGRVREFTDRVLGQQGRSRSIVIAATSDQSPVLKRRAAWTAMATAEHFRDMGAKVLLLVDSVTRFADAHREVALISGESASMRGYPPSTAQMIMDLCERAGPGAEGAGDISAIFSVLVAGSDMEEPVADILRGVLDGHIVLDRGIAERGRFPAIDVLRSVSRSLPDAATESENQLLAEGRRVMSTFDQARLMVQSGLYAPGADADLDRAVSLNDSFERFLSRVETSGVEGSFEQLRSILADSAEESPPATEAGVADVVERDGMI
jgi:flagellum-specific ATP synthase